MVWPNGSGIFYLLYESLIFQMSFFLFLAIAIVAINLPYPSEIEMKFLLLLALFTNNQ